MKKNIIITILIIFCITLFASCGGARSVVGIFIYSEPDKTVYFVGEELDIAGCKIIVKYANGSEKTVDVAPSMVTGFDTSAVGTRTMTITYKHAGKVYTTTQEIETKGRKAAAIEIDTLPTKLVYADGEAITLEGILVNVTYNNGETGTVGYGALSHNPVFARLGNTSVTVKLDNAATAYEITVLPIAVVGLTIVQLPEKTKYIVGERFKEQGLILAVVYNDSSKEQVNEGFKVVEDTIASDMEGIVIKYKNMEIICPITVIPIEVIEHKIINSPKTEYIVGDVLDIWGLCFDAVLNNGHEVRLEYGSINFNSVELVSPHGPLVLENDKIILHYHYDEDEYYVVEIAISVSVPRFVSFELGRYMHQTKYVAGEEINLNGLELLAVYNNGDKVTIIDDEVLDPDVLYNHVAEFGMENLVFEYKGKTYEYPITVTLE